MAVEVGVRELRENLATWLDRAAAGEEILITERGRPKARLTAAETILDRLEREGKITRPTGQRRPLPPRIEMEGSIMPYLEWARGGPWPGREERGSGG
ncbi:MAG: type II toxin-antitoxin system prevent-host-death family antitoxin [Gaiella sp.]|nr:type II toxin-antitoxin system prevent-host-death family antitoxin [Gaiella sp.]